MKNTIKKSFCEDTIEAINEVTEGLDNPKLILFFADDRNFEKISIELNKKFEKSIVIGVTSYMIFADKDYAKKGIVLAAIDDVECYPGIIQDGGRFPMSYVHELKNNIAKINNKKDCVCLEFSAMSYYCEEISLDALYQVLNLYDIPIFGGSAGSDNSMQNVALSLNGKVYHETCIYVLLKNLSGKIHFYKENIYKPTDYEFIATDVEVSERIVYEYNNEPAAKIIARTLRTDINLLPEILRRHPMGRIVGNDIYITDFNRLVAENGISYYSNIYNNTKLILLEPDDYKKVLHKTMNKITSVVKNTSFSIVVNCVSRTQLFEEDGFLGEFSSILNESLGNYIGLSGFGEQLEKHHLNQTMIIAVFE